MKLSWVLLATLMSFSLTVKAEQEYKMFEVIVEVHEVDKLDLVLVSDTSGYVRLGDGKCKITADTKAMKNFQPVKLASIKEQRGKPALVSCEVASLQVTEIKWQN